MKGRRRLEKRKEHISSGILLDMLNAGAKLAVEVVNTEITILAHNPYLGRMFERYYPSSVERHVQKLWRKGYVETVETAEGFIVRLTQKGKMEILKYDLDNMSIDKQNPWDGKWRMIFFDIPSGENKARYKLAECMKSMGFFQIQKSVYVHPYPCIKQIQYLREVLNIPHDIKFATIERLENDDDLRRIFKLE